MGFQVCGYGFQVAIYGKLGVWIWATGTKLWVALEVPIYGRKERYPFMGNISGFDWRSAAGISDSEVTVYGMAGALTKRWPKRRFSEGAQAEGTHLWVLFGGEAGGVPWWKSP